MAAQSKVSSRSRLFARLPSPLNDKTNAPALFAFSVRWRNLIRKQFHLCQHKAPLASPAVLLWMAEVLAKTNPTLRRAPYPRFYRQFPVRPNGPGRPFSNSVISLPTAETGNRPRLIQQSDPNTPMNDVAARATDGRRQARRGTLRRGDQTLPRSSPGQEWKGELWPQALYFLGESLRDKEKEAYAVITSAHLRPLPPILRILSTKPIFVAPRFPKSSA